MGRENNRTDTNTILLTKTVEFAIQCRVAFKHAPVTVAAATQLGHFAKTSVGIDATRAMDHIHSARSIGRHALLLDDALDLYTKRVIEKARGKTFFGFAFSSDESPPQGNRWAGLRFQLTYTRLDQFRHCFPRFCSVLDKQIVIN